MNLKEFKDSLSNETPPKGLSVALQALWHEGNDDWTAAHDLLQGASGQAGDWVHAYLHRVEGDLSNANYWYRRAGRTQPESTLEAEWEAIVAELLSSGAS